MCLIALAYRVHPDYPLLLVANRDEFHARPAAPMQWWADAPSILAGRDLQEGGSWLALSRGGRLAAVTNVRGPDAATRAARSRGQLVTGFLQGAQNAATYASAMQATASEYGGFNLLLFDGRELIYLHNRPQVGFTTIPPGVHALSNAQLNTPWPKALSAHQALQDWISRDLSNPDALLDAMRNSQPAADALLPQTGVGIELERMLSAAFIRTEQYGTRCTSLIRHSADGTIEFFERRYAPSGEVAGENREEFVPDPA
ncbi:MAG: NRDE family protein [Panacagrimonas sp.]